MIIWKFHHVARTESTNLDARTGGAFEVFVADEQTAGRGRLSHVWFSPPGLNLYFSIVLPVGSQGPAEVVTLPLVVGLAICETVNRFLRTSGHQTVACAIKWPNDVLVRHKKICGILCERHGDMVIAGIGLNVNVREVPPELAHRMTSLALETDRAFERAAVLTAMLDAVGTLYETWVRSGFAPLLPRIAPFDCLKGHQVSVIQTDTDATPLRGSCHGIQSDGTLLIGDRNIFAGESHIDSF